MRLVGEESRKTYEDKLKNGFFDRFMSGKGLDIGYNGYLQGVVPILDTAIGIDVNYPGYDSKTLPFADNSQDYVYSSHVLEHIQDSTNSIREWFRVTKCGGFIITIVPHQWLYEKKLFLPSKFNGDHKRFYEVSDLIKSFEISLPINSFRVRHLQDNDHGHDYTQSDDEHSLWCYEIEMVVQKL